MSKLQTLRKILSYAPKKAMVACGVIAAVAIPFAVGAYGPERPTYTIEHPADHITFNSITNNPNIGDERNFVAARDTGSGSKTWNANEITVQEGKEYIVRMYVHNNAAANLNLVAENVNAKFNVPTTTGNSVTVSGILSSSNATPNEYWDSVNFVSEKAFNLAYVPGSALWENNGIGAGGSGIKMADSVVENAGVALGYNALDGRIPGCFQYAGYLTFKVKPQFQHNVAIGLTKSVALHNDIADPSDKLDNTAWKQSVDAKPGDVVDYVIDYRNAGDVNQLGVVIRDILPSNMTYVPGSTKYVIYRSNGELYREGDWGGADTITENGINASEADSGFAPTALAHSYVAMFSAKVNETYVPECGTAPVLKNIARVSVTADGERFQNEDDADVVVKGEDCAEAIYTCDALNVNKISRTKFDLSTDYTIENATFVKVTYVINGDSIVVTNADTKYTYNQETPGKYVVQSFITVNTDDGEKTSNLCNGEIEVTTPPEFCEVPGKEHLPKNDPNCVANPIDPPKPPKGHNVPTELPQTGGEMLGLLGLGGLTTSAGYYISSRRKLSKM